MRGKRRKCLQAQTPMNGIEGKGREMYPGQNDDEQY